MTSLSVWTIVVLCACAGYSIVAVLFRATREKGSQAPLSSLRLTRGALGRNGRDFESKARAILGAPACASQEEIRARYLELVSLYDPQKREYFTEELKRAAEEKTHDVVWAYGVLAANDSAEGHPNPT